MSAKNNVPAPNTNEQIVIIQTQSLSEDEVKNLVKYFEEIISIPDFCNYLQKATKLLPLMFMQIDSDDFFIDKNEVLTLVGTFDHLAEVLEAA
jgi:hypothetical protein